jgi:hypothetical protein
MNKRQAKQVAAIAAGPYPANIVATTRGRQTCFAKFILIVGDYAVITGEDCITATIHVPEDFEISNHPPGKAWELEWESDSSLKLVIASAPLDPVSKVHFWHLEAHADRDNKKTFFEGEVIVLCWFKARSMKFESGFTIVEVEHHQYILPREAALAQIES